jgi:hypothetical protein
MNEHGLRNCYEDIIALLFQPTLLDYYAGGQSTPRFKTVHAGCHNPMKSKSKSGRGMNNSNHAVFTSTSQFELSFRNSTVIIDVEGYKQFQVTDTSLLKVLFSKKVRLHRFITDEKNPADSILIHQFTQPLFLQRLVTCRNCSHVSPAQEPACLFDGRSDHQGLRGTGTDAQAWPRGLRRN